MSVDITTFQQDRTAVVTGVGAPRGIGRVVARRLAEEGWSLARWTSARPEWTRSPWSCSPTVLGPRAPSPTSAPRSPSRPRSHTSMTCCRRWWGW